MSYFYAVLNNWANSDSVAIEGECTGSSGEEYWDAAEDCAPESVDRAASEESYEAESAPMESVDSVTEAVTNGMEDEGIYGEAYVGEFTVIEAAFDADGEFVGYFVEVLEMKEAYEADFDYEAEFFEGQQIFIDGYETWQSNLADMPVFEENLFEPGEVIEAEVIYIDIYPAEPAENYHCFRIFSLL